MESPAGRKVAAWMHRSLNDVITHKEKKRLVAKGGILSASVRTNYNIPLVESGAVDTGMCVGPGNGCGCHNCVDG